MNGNQGQNGKPEGRLLAAQTSSPSQVPAPLVSRRARPCMSEGSLPQPKMTLMQLLQSPKQVPVVLDARSMKRAEALTYEWRNFYAKASREEKEIAFPSMVRFLDKLCDLVYATREPSYGNQLIGMLDSLSSSEPNYVLGQLVQISKLHPAENISLAALSCLESNFGLMLSTPGRSPFNLIWKVLDIYEKQPSQLMRASAQEFAKTASSFIFAHKEYLMANGYKNLVPYGVAWGAGIEINDRVKFMEDISDGNDDCFKTALLSRVIMLAQSFPCGSPCRFEAPPTARLIEEFPEIARVDENRRRIAETIESWGTKRLVESAVSLLGYSGKQFFYLASPPSQLQ